MKSIGGCKIMSSKDAQFDGSCNNYLVKKMLDKGVVAMIYGPRRIDNTAFALKLAHHIAEGKEYLGRRVKKSRVLYLNLSQMNAWRELIDDADAGFDFVYASPGDFFAKPSDWGKALHAIKGGRYDLVIIDSLALFLGPDNANEAVARGKALYFADLVESKTGATTLYVHQGKPDSDEHFGIKAAVDCLLLVDRDERTRCTVTLEKLRDYESGQITFV